MARPNKDGLDYFPFDVDFFQDERIEAISGEFGIKGEIFIVKLLSAVYKKGYFVVWNDLVKSQLLKRVPGASKDLLDQIVNRLVTWGYFDESLFNSAKVLTSEEIQATYLEATKRRKSPKPTKYLINVDINPQTTVVNANINTQSKVNKTKVNKTKQNTKPAPRKKREYPDSDPNMKLAKFLYKNILDHGIEIKKPNLQKWADTLRLLIERDERPGKQVQDTIKWIYQDAVDPFWRNTVQSAEGLRRNFDQITGKIKLEKEQPIGGHSHQKPAKQAETVPEWMQKKEYQPVDDESMETFNEAMKKLKGASG